MTADGGVELTQPPYIASLLKEVARDIKDGCISTAAGVEMQGRVTGSTQGTLTDRARQPAAVKVRAEDDAALLIVLGVNSP